MTIRRSSISQTTTRAFLALVLSCLAFLTVGQTPPARAAGNNAPTCSDFSLTTGERTTIQVTPYCSDLDGDPLTYAIVTQPSGGTASVAEGKIVYTPNPGFLGVEQFTYKANDGQADSNTAAVTATVTGIDHPPTDILLSKTEIEENLPVGSLVGAFSTSDPDAADTFTYGFSGGSDDDAFQISGDTLRSAMVFDYETKSAYSVCIRSTDHSALSVTHTFALTVRDRLETATFADVPLTHWAWRHIEALSAAGITGGCGVSPRTYCPASAVTRDQMAVFLLKALHGSAYMPPAVGANSGFDDVPITYWAAAWIKQLAAEGITSGCGGGSFCPTRAITRDQMAVFLLRAKHGSGYAPPAPSGALFVDVPSTHWAAAWIEQLVAEGITSGCGGGNFCPSVTVTRDQMAVFLVKAFNIPLP